MSQETLRKYRSNADIVERLYAVKPSHGNWRKSQDAIREILKIRQERDEALALVDDLRAQLNHSRAA